MPERRRILYARAGSGGFGGIESQIDRLADAAADKGALVPALLTDDPSSLLAGRFRAKGREVLVVPMGRFGGRAAARALERLLDPASVALVESHMFRESFVGRALKRRRPGVAHAFRAHTYVDCSWIPEWRKRAYHLADRLTAGAVDLFLANGRGLRDELVGRSGVPAGKVAVVLNGVDGLGEAALSRWESSAPPPARLAMVANLVPHKGHDVLIRALALLGRDGSRPRARLIGSETADPAQAAAVRRLAAEAGVLDQLEFSGFTERVGDALAGAPVVVLPSDAEGLPLSVLEAMSAAKIVVASAVGAVPECVTDGKDGFLHAPGDAAALAATLGRVFASPETALRPVAEAARETWRTRFTVERMTRDIAAAYRERLGLEVY